MERALLEQLVGRDERRLALAESLLRSRASPPPNAALATDRELVDTLVRRLARAGRPEHASRLARIARERLLVDLQRPWSLIYLLSALQNAAPQFAEPQLPGMPQTEPTENGHRPDPSPARVNDPNDLPKIVQPPPANGGRPSPNLTPARSQPPTVPDSEKRIIGEVIYAIQGIDGPLIRFDPSTGTFALNRDHPDYPPPPTRSLIFTICEVGFLIRHLTSTLDSLSTPARGLISAALASALQTEMNTFFTRLAALQSALDSPDTTNRSTETPRPTLRAIAAWSYDIREPLRWLAHIADSARLVRGSKVADVVYSYTRHGDTAVAAMASRVFDRATVPLASVLLRWVRDGELDDAHGEFFVKKGKVEEEAWDGGYEINDHMLPLFVQRKVAEKALLAGKSVRFLRIECDEAEWLVTRRGHNNPSTVSFNPWTRANTALYRVVDKALTSASERLKAVLMEKYGFLQHCADIKRFLLLGQGDFVQGLLEMLGPELNKPMQLLLRSTLIRIFEAEFWNSSRGDEKRSQKVLDHLDIGFLEGSAGDCGWDVFSLEYRISDTPLGIIFTKHVMQTYHRVFNFLWSMRRVHHALNTLWHRQRTTAKLNRDMRAPSLDAHKFVIRSCLLHTKMTQFIQSIQYYVMFEVLEEAWVTLQSESEKASDLPSLVTAHSNYLTKIVERCLLSEAARPLYAHLSAQMDVILRFAALHDAAGTTPKPARALHQLDLFDREFSQHLSEFLAAVDNAQLPGLPPSAQLFPSHIPVT